MDRLEDPNGDGDQSDSIAANTLVIFTSDNGGTHADNLPLKGKKGMLTEGGIRVPLIARWPGVVPAGAVSDRKVHSVDYYPTFLQLAGNGWRPPEGENPLDGESFAEVLRRSIERKGAGADFLPFSWLFGMCGRSRRWWRSMKLRGSATRFSYYYETDSWELYCLSDDQSEEKNLIKEKPEIAAGMAKKIRAWLTQGGPTWKPKYPIRKSDGKPAGAPVFEK